jgi:hypothetical protein
LANVGIRPTGVDDAEAWREIERRASQRFYEVGRPEIMQGLDPAQRVCMRMDLELWRLQLPLLCCGKKRHAKFLIDGYGAKAITGVPRSFTVRPRGLVTLLENRDRWYRYR